MKGWITGALMGAVCGSAISFAEKPVPAAHYRLRVVNSNGETTYESTTNGEILFGGDVIQWRNMHGQLRMIRGLPVIVEEQ